MPRGALPRIYPPEMVAFVVAAYAAGSTIREIQEQLPSGYKAQRMVERFVSVRRAAAKRDQSGPANHMWRGEDAGYQALHLRVEQRRGKPSKCEWCDQTEGRFEWANLTGNYTNTDDYARLCVACHRAFDAGRRATTGRRTSPLGEVVPNA